MDFILYFQKKNVTEMASYSSDEESSRKTEKVRS